MQLTPTEVQLIRRLRKIKNSKSYFGHYLKAHLEQIDGHFIGDECWRKFSKVLSRIFRMRYKE